MDDKAINLKEKFTKFSERWSPRVVAEMNDYQFKLAKLKDDFVWHDHKDTDEVFLVVHGSMSIEFEDRTVDLNEGESLLCPKGLNINHSQKRNVTFFLLNHVVLSTLVRVAEN